MSQTEFSSLVPGDRYQTMSTRPGSPATIHGIMFMPLSDAGLTRIGAVHDWPLLVEVAKEIFEPSDQTTYRLPALSTLMAGNTVATLPPGVPTVKSSMIYGVPSLKSVMRMTFKVAPL